MVGLGIGVYYLIAAAVTPSFGGGSAVMPVSAAAAVLIGAALLAYGGKGYRQSGVLAPADQGAKGRSSWW